MQSPCDSGTNTVVYDRTLDLGQYNLLLPELVRWLTLIKVDRQQTHKTTDYILTRISRIPEVQIINNLVFPNWIINSSYDIDYVLVKLLRNPQFWRTHYHWIDARGITIYQTKYLHVLESALVEFLKWCDFVIVNTPIRMTLTEFWEWLVSCKELDEPCRARIIFFTKQQAKTYKTAAAGTIPLNIAKSQKDFISSFNSRNTGNASNTGCTGLITNCKGTSVDGAAATKILLQGDLQSPSKILLQGDLQSPTKILLQGDNSRLDGTHTLPQEYKQSEESEELNEPTNREPSGSELICIQELDKLRRELLDYNLASPDALGIETGAIIEKINNIRELLGINC